MPDLLTSLVPWLEAPWPLWVAAAVIALSAPLLALGAHSTVESAVVIADRLGMAPHIVGLTVVAMGTSAPEFAVSVTAALGGNNDLAISNIVGSNIFNLGFILGGVAILSPITTDATVVFRDGAVLLLSSIAVWVLFGIDLGVERSNGALLLLGLAAYLTLLLRAPRTPVEPRADGAPTLGEKAAPFVKLALSIAVIAVAADLLVEAASSVASSFGVSEWAIGVTIIAAGTSLPEFTTSVVAAWKGHHALGLGNIIGSDIFNVLGVLGLTAVIQPVVIRPEASSSILALLAMVALTLVFLRSGWRLTRAEGAILIACAVFRWYLDLT